MAQLFRCRHRFERTSGLLPFRQFGSDDLAYLGDAAVAAVAVAPDPHHCPHLGEGLAAAHAVDDPRCGRAAKCSCASRPTLPRRGKHAEASQCVSTTALVLQSEKASMAEVQKICATKRRSVGMGKAVLVGVDLS
jgi:hypothetical protein